MSIEIRIIIIGFAIIIFSLVFELVRRKRFREELSVLWFAVAFLTVAGAFADVLINPLASFLEVGYPPILIMFFLMIISILSLLYFSMVISDLKGKIKELTQKISFIEYDVEKVKHDANPDHKQTM